MNDDTLQTRLDTQEELLQKIYTSTEKTRRYFLWTLIISAVVIILPIIGLFFAIPAFLSTYSALGGL